jgi:hypothetical protein
MMMRGQQDESHHQTTGCKKELNSEITLLRLSCIRCNRLTTAYLNTGDRTDGENVGMLKIYCESCANNFGDFDEREISDRGSLK